MYLPHPAKNSGPHRTVSEGSLSTPDFKQKEFQPAEENGLNFFMPPTF